jgi:hypothetical protein
MFPGFSAGFDSFRRHIPNPGFAVFAKPEKPVRFSQEPRR